MLPVRVMPGRRGGFLMDWDPFRQLERVSRLFDLRDRDGGEMAVRRFEVDVREDEEHYFIEANLPGVSKENVDLTVEDGVLTISAQNERDEERKDENFHIREREIGKFSRSFRLPSEVDTESVNATLSNGVLTVTLDKAETARPRKITVKDD